MVQSWGRILNLTHDQKNIQKDDLQFASGNENLSTFHAGGRSYGDSCLNNGGLILKTSSFDNILGFNPLTGIIKVESGVTISDMCDFTFPQGWVLPVVPGSKYVTIGGAVAHDVHGKNHSRSGSFGTHILRICLVRSDGETLILSATQNKELFAVTISGLGLTGFIQWIEIQLCSVDTPYLDVEHIKFTKPEQYFELSDDSTQWPYMVGWLDLSAGKEHFGRGIFTRARHVSSISQHQKANRNINLNITPSMGVPSVLINRLTSKAFNFLYYHRPKSKFTGLEYFDDFHFPLDRIQNWNRLLGNRGFYQHHCMLPHDCAQEVFVEILTHVRRSSEVPMLAVIKTHGQETSPGLNSFCFKGYGLAIDFANRGISTFNFLQALNQLVTMKGGRMYPAKDQTMRAEEFKIGYPNWKMIERYRDPELTSAFWQRVSGEVNN